MLIPHGGPNLYQEAEHRDWGVWIGEYQGGDVATAISPGELSQVPHFEDPPLLPGLIAQGVDEPKVGGDKTNVS